MQIFSVSGTRLHSAATTTGVVCELIVLSRIGMAANVWLGWRNFTCDHSKACLTRLAYLLRPMGNVWRHCPTCSESSPYVHESVNHSQNFVDPQTTGVTYQQCRVLLEKRQEKTDDVWNHRSDDGNMLSSHRDEFMCNSFMETLANIRLITCCYTCQSGLIPSV